MIVGVACRCEGNLIGTFIKLGLSLDRMPLGFIDHLIDMVRHKVQVLIILRHRINEFLDSR